jgi:hypothetical protein
MGARQAAIRNAVLASAAIASLAWGAPPETIHKTFQGARSVEVDNAFGPIHVTGFDGDTVQVDVQKTIEADSDDRRAAAEREVKLDVTQNGDSVRLYVDGPFRCHCEEGHGFRERNHFSESHHRGYKVSFAFDVKVPRTTAIYLATIGDGNVVVENVAGDFDVENINGSVRLDGMSGSGRAYALNGSTTATFNKNPAANSYFGSLNGAVDVAFQPALSADVRVKTFNGGVFTDFDVAALPSVVSAGERKEGKFVYRSNDFHGFRIGHGGPEYKFENFNGDIRIRNRGK